MAVETTAPKRSFFKDYFLFKLRRCKAYTITFAVLNILIYIAPAVFFLTVIAADGYGMSYYIGTLMAAAFISLALVSECVVIVVMTAVNLKAFHSRSAMDTICALPLTVSQRYLGDTLSGLAAYMLSFVPCAVCTLIISTVIQFQYAFNYTSNDYFFVRLHDNIIGLAAMLILTLFICTLAAYAMACLVSSCSGKLGVSIVFSIVAVFAVPIIVFSVCGYTVKDVAGLSDLADYLALSSAEVIPPVGTFICLIRDLCINPQSQYVFPAQTPRLLIMLAFIIVPMLGSYLIAMHRKAESVDKPFVFKPCYSIASLLMVACALSLMLITLEVPMFYVPLLIFVLGACLYLEYLRTHSKSRLLIGLLRFAGAAVLCGIFVLLVSVTSNFNIGKKIPRENNVESVRIWSIDETIYSHDAIISDDPNVISTVIKEHKKLVDNLDKFSEKDFTGAGLQFTYYMKDGSVIIRDYNSVNKESKQLIENFKTAVRTLPEIRNQTTLGILGNPDMPCVGIEIESSNNSYTAKRYLKSSVQDEFIEALKKDILNRFDSGNYTGSIENEIYYTYIDSKSVKKTLRLWTYSSYKEIGKFLNDPNNFVTDFSLEIGENPVYSVDYILAAGEMPVLDCSFTAGSTAAQELISYFETEYSEDGDYSEKLIVSANGKTLHIKRENERAALSALIRLMKELETRGEL